MRLCLRASSPWAIAPNEMIRTNTLTLAALIGCGDGSAANIATQVGCLRAVSAAILAYVQWDSRIDSAGYSIPFQPVIDGVFLPNTTDVGVLPAAAQKKPLIIGVNRNEGMFFILYRTPMFYNNLTNTPSDFAYSDLQVRMFLSSLMTVS